MTDSLPVVLDDFYFDIDSFSSGVPLTSAYLEIGFVLSGSAHIFLGHDHYMLQKKDVYFSNRYEMCDIRPIGSEPLHTLSLMVSPGLIERYHLSNVRFDNFVSVSGKNEEVFTLIKHHLAMLFQCYFRKPLESSLLESYKLVFTILDLANKSFGSPVKLSGEDVGTRARLQRVISYIEENYAQSISLNEVAQQEYLSVGHFSRLFHSNIGMSFTKYLQRTRLIHASKDLYTTNSSITEIAMNNGFSSANAFISSFKDVYGSTPGVVRFSCAEAPLPDHGSQTPDLYQRLLEYCSIPKNCAPESHPVKSGIPFSVDCKNDKTKKSPLPSIDYVTINYADNILSQSFQHQIIESHKDLGYRYLCIHGCLSDAMMVYREDADGKPIYNFTYVDMVLDFVTSLGLIPYIACDHLPYELAGSAKILYSRGIYEGMPTSMVKWSALIRNFLLHCTSRYGMAEVQKWCFATPNASLIYSGFFTLQEYITIYHETFRVVKGVHSSIKVMAMEHYIDAMVENNFSDLEVFLSNCRETNCFPDGVAFRGFHSSFSKSLFLPANVVAQRESRVENQKADDIYRFLTSVRQICKKHGCADMKIILDVWNSAMIPEHDLSSDTCYKAAYLAKNFLECRTKNTEINYWNLTDFLDNINPDQEIFHGGCGLYTFNGIAKSTYYAIQLLNKVGPFEIAKGEGYYVSRTKNGNLQIVMYNYCHFNFDILVDQQDASAPFDRYSFFEDSRDLSINLTLTDIPTGQYDMEEYVLNRENGDAYSRWIDMGAPLQMKESQSAWLKSMSQPKYRTTSEVSLGSIEFSAVLQPHELRLYCLTFQ